MVIYRPTQDRIARTVHDLGEGPWARRELIAWGWSAKQLERAVEHGGLRRRRPGVYARPETTHAPDRGHLAEIRAVLAGLSLRAVVSHGSAACVTCMWTPTPDLSRLHVTIPGHSERTDSRLTVHGSRLPRTFITELDGIRVTTVARTAMDLARGSPFPDALVAIDGAARLLLRQRLPQAAWRIRERAVPAELVTEVMGELHEAFAVMWSWPGTRVVSRALSVADLASESPFESRSRAWILQAGLPGPVVNGRIVGATGRPYFGDFVWEEQRVVGEADGLGKYGTTPEELRRRLAAQSRRQDDLERAGWTVVRWTTSDPPQAVITRLARALRLQARVTA